jgi:DNA-binding GntR family transcriptional regulator
MTATAAAPSPLAPAAYRTKAEIVYAQLREQILSGGLAPGQRITLAGLAKQLEVSVMPIRDALARLEREGLVSQTPHRDIHVTDLAVHDITQLFDIRGALEALAARTAAQNAASRCAEQLVSADARMRGAYAARDFYAMADANWGFHRAILAAAGNPHLARMLEDVWARCFRFRLGYKLIPGRAEATFTEHAAIIAAMRAGDEAAVAAAAQDHVGQAARDLLRVLDSSGRVVDPA